MNLDEIRVDIDKIDKDIVELIKKRMNLSLSVAEYKINNGKKVFDAEREKTILDKVDNLGGEYGHAARLIYSTIMEQSRALQYPLVNSELGIKAEPLDPDSIKKVACQGVKGAYSYVTAKQLYKNAEIIFCERFSDVFDAVERGDAEIGVVPVENSWAGSVHEVYDLLIERKFYIANAVDARISHNLIGTKDAEISDIKQALSHEQALRQCAEFLDKKDIEPIGCLNTAIGVKKAAEMNNKQIGAIGSTAAANEFGMKILAQNIASSDCNVTRFVSVSNKFYTSENADKISIVFSIPHKPGALYSVFSRFAAAGLNMSKIESRPIKNHNFEYLFYVDLIGKLISKDTLCTINSLSEELDEFTLMGNYEEKEIKID
ncbi:MAG: chorismate mutase [Clostridia bacterium]|nr:chorismate mutase [Clostridia bacterium]